MKKSYRVKRERDFNDIFTKGNNVANRRFVVYRLPKEQKHFRVGLSVSKKLGNAVTRTRIKRRLRHVLIECQQHLVSADFVIIARKGVEELNYQEIKQNLIHVLKLAKLYQEGVEIEKES
ncbi:ribonuclease P protein component [Streptococcus suis]|uniref:ribonuclease P protein component n=1 Tax=Streptococcus suis TaxID=1307 RepID=UPI001C98C495|nr:ribonuclease P protein component [Streptococcus suis]MBY5001178.1 ribonuclease P protein component [Streptococcus suis]MBY5012336.1 ribonuclease P protein component [Streptococcus suis]MBY5019055.1 ribonuclease P protein component [Streptococcus suis]